MVCHRLSAAVVVAAVLTFIGSLSANAACAGSSPNWTSANASRAEVLDCVNKSKSGDTINVPAGAYSWTGSIAVNSKDLSIIGSGVGKTVITCSSFCFSIGVGDGTSSASRISGFTFVNGMIELGGLNPSKAFRIDHCRFTSSSQRELTISGYNYPLPPQGLIDNNTFELTRFIIYGTAYMLNEGPWQHRIWASDPGFGGPQAIYIEDNVIGNSHPGTIDSNYGGRFVYRFNSVTPIQTYANEFHGVQGDNRAGQRWEIYGNTFTNSGSSALWTTSYLRGATGYYFDNSLAGTWNSGPVLKVERSCETKSPFGQCDGTWNIDGNTSGAQGWPCRDQIGRSRDVSTYGGTGAWPAQSLTPAYSWNNRHASTGTRYGFVGYAGCSRESTLHSLENRDWYNQDSSFNGTKGVGRGLLSARPNTCTTGVAYWATDQGEWNAKVSGPDGALYKCTATNTWSLYYTPYAYPHPLQGGTVDPPPPPPGLVAPTGLQTTVH